MPGHHWAMHVPRGNAVDPDVVPSVMHRHGVAQADDAPFGGGVRMTGPPTTSPQANYRGKVDDRAATCLYHLGAGMFAGEHNAFQVHINYRIPKVLIHVSNGTGTADAHVVDQHVQL